MSKESWYASNFLWGDLLATSAIYAASLYVNHRWRILELEWDAAVARSFFATIASVAGNLFGFIIAGITIVASLLGDQRLAVFKDSPRVRDLFDTFFSALKWTSVATLLSVAGMIYKYQKYDRIFLVIIGYFIIVSIARLARTVRVTWLIVEKLIPKGRRVLPATPSLDREHTVPDAGSDQPDQATKDDSPA